MTYTRQSLRDLCRRRLGDLDLPYKWSDLQINQWINDAIADYSIHFPRRVELKLDCTLDTHSYELPADCHGLLSVEYPQGQDPPEYLQPADRFADGFYACDDLYDFLPSHDQDSPGKLWISANPTAAQDINLIYLADHDYPDDDADEITVLERHYELILLYVRWAAYQELACSESSDPDPTSLALSTLELNAYRAQRLYLQALEKAHKAEAHSAMATWKMDRWNRIY
jgi:hypothetical protein